MTNEMKLLMAFIEASGFEVEEVYGTEPCEEMIKHGWAYEVDGYKITKKDLSIVLEALDDATTAYPSHAVDHTSRAYKAYDIMSDFLKVKGND